MGEARRRRETGAVSRSARRRIRRQIISAAAAFVAVFGLGGLYYVLTTPGAAPVNDLPQVRPDGPPFPTEVDRFGVSVGSMDAPVVVREFADYQCPACARLAPIMERFRERYVASGKVRLVYFDFPLDLHPNAVPAAMAARCAADQGAYWTMQGRLFAQQSQWAEEADPVQRFLGYARDLGLDAERLRHCIAADRYRDDVERSRQVAARLRVRRTPTVYVNNVRLTRPGWYQLSGVAERVLAGSK